MAFFRLSGSFFSSRNEISKTGHVLSIHLGESFSFSVCVCRIGWLMAFSLISENWCDASYDKNVTLCKKRDSEKENWPALLNINHQRIISLLFFERARCRSLKKTEKRAQNVHNRIDNRLTRILRPMKRRGTFYEFFIFPRSCPDSILKLIYGKKDWAEKCYLSKRP